MNTGYCERCDEKKRVHMGRCYECGAPVEVDPETERTALIGTKEVADAEVSSRPSGGEKCRPKTKVCEEKTIFWDGEEIDVSQIQIEGVFDV